MGGAARDHGGGLDAAVARHGGTRAGWIDLSTGINPLPYPVPPLPGDVWSALPDSAASTALERAARSHWNVPEGAAVLAAPGASALIARLPALASAARVHIAPPTYNEHAAAFAAHGWELAQTAKASDVAARVIVNPNNPTGHWHDAAALGAPLTIIDESFADIRPEGSLIAHAGEPGVIVLKSFGKFWGLAGLRLGFAIGAPDLIARLGELLGPWPVSGPALAVGALALNDTDWAARTRARLDSDTARLDGLMQGAGAQVAGGCALFRLYRVDNAAAWQERLAKHHIWSRRFPYADDWLRLGLPAPGAWNRLEGAL
ncbi:MAG: threonine-phosphate decarboxylase CobD [Pseudomonadota bacterium]|uniref:threonine-phosphate decarboxylase CobD n=1 Tax=Roseovarius TaxID=74030 RepID=UPI0022A82055|nr:threonine-phosphate decarboxylase CobD [Roseovarius sp. EGI FJ00037]MCZ0812521.1 threonine-phosphate decarboxylase CobD [Roseovarius sp. EGI FJ00037]